MSRWKRAKNENKQLLATSRNGNRSTFVFTSTGKYSVHVEYYCDYYFNKLKITSIIWFNCHLKLYWLWFEFIKKYLLCLVERFHCTRTGTTTWIPSNGRRPWSLIGRGGRRTSLNKTGPRPVKNYKGGGACHSRTVSFKDSIPSFRTIFYLFELAFGLDFATRISVAFWFY